MFVGQVLLNKYLGCNPGPKTNRIVCNILSRYRNHLGTADRNLFSVKPANGLYTAQKEKSTSWSAKSRAIKSSCRSMGTRMWILQRNEVFCDSNKPINTSFVQMGCKQHNGKIGKLECEELCHGIIMHVRRCTCVPQSHHAVLHVLQQRKPMRYASQRVLMPKPLREKRAQTNWRHPCAK